MRRIIHSWPRESSPAHETVPSSSADREFSALEQGTQPMMIP